MKSEEEKKKCVFVGLWSLRISLVGRQRSLVSSFGWSCSLSRRVQLRKFEKKTLKITFSLFKHPKLVAILKIIQKATPLSPLAFVAIVTMASHFEDRLATKLKGDEGSPRLSPLVTKRLPFTHQFEVKFQQLCLCIMPNTNATNRSN